MSADRGSLAWWGEPPQRGEVYQIAAKGLKVQTKLLAALVAIAGDEKDDAIAALREAIDAVNILVALLEFGESDDG